MRIVLVMKQAHEDTGVGRYASRLSIALKSLGHEVIPVHPAAPLPGWIVRAARKLLKWDLKAFFENYPIWARYPRADIYHLTSQNLATLMVFHRPPGKTVVTIHDIIPHITRNDREISPSHHWVDDLFDCIAVRSLSQAAACIAVSEHTRLSLVLELGYPAEKIIVIHEGVG